MAVTIRQAAPGDVAPWLDLFRSCVGEEYVTKRAYEPNWLATQLNPETGCETWIADDNGTFKASVSFLPSGLPNKNPVVNLGRHLNRPESYTDGSAEMLLKKINDMALEQGRMVVARVIASDKAQQSLHEKLGFVCVGFQPFKHMHKTREGVLFYVRVGRPEAVTRFPLSESLPQIKELAGAALNNLKLPNLMTMVDGVTGYPLQTEVNIHDASYEDFELWRLQAQAQKPPVEVSGGYNRGLGYMRFDIETPLRAILGQREDKIVAGLAYFFDDHDRCVRVIDTFAIDDLSSGAMFQRASKIAQEQLSAIYIEVDVVMTAPRLLKSTEQMGFVPIAYLPGFFYTEGLCADVVKLVKLNMVYSLENVDPTPQARAMIQVIDRNFEEQKVGVAMINLLRALPIFDGLGDGELRKLTRLFTQKLFRPGDKVFNKGDLGTEAYVVMRGQIDIYLDELAKPIASIANGQIFGEFAFLDGAPRVAIAIANQATILLVVQRQAFQDLVQREPHLGMVVMRNVAMELSNKLRKANSTIAQMRR